MVLPKPGSYKIKTLSFKFLPYFYNPTLSSRHEKMLKIFFMVFHSRNIPLAFCYSWSYLTKFHDGVPTTLETIPPCFRYDDFTNWFPSRTRLKTLKLNNLRLQQPQVVTSLNYKWQDAASLTLSKIKRNGWLVKTSIIFFLKTKWGIISFEDWKKAKKL